MPTYDFECDKCGNIFEYFQKMTAEPVTVCPKCQNAAKRLISGGSGVIFKGTGFYETDYKKKSKSSEDNKSPSCPNKDICKGCPSDKKKK